MKFKLRKTPDEVIEAAVAAVTRAKGYLDDVEFSAEDATRSDWDFLCRIVAATIKAGATTIKLRTDSVAAPMLPREMTVTVTGATTSGLFVPAEAIVARDLRGYAVEVVAPSGRTEFVDVEIGVVAGRSVQVLSPALTAGTVVIAP